MRIELYIKSSLSTYVSSGAYLEYNAIWYERIPNSESSKKIGLISSFTFKDWMKSTFKLSVKNNP